MDTLLWELQSFGKFTKCSSFLIRSTFDTIDRMLKYNLDRWRLVLFIRSLNVNTQVNSPPPSSVFSLDGVIDYHLCNY